MSVGGAPPSSPICSVSRQLMSELIELPSTLVTVILMVYFPLGPENVQANCEPTLASMPEGQLTSVGVKPDLAATSRLITSTADAGTICSGALFPQPVNCRAAAPKMAVVATRVLDLIVMQRILIGGLTPVKLRGT